MKSTGQSSRILSCKGDTFLSISEKGQKYGQHMHVSQPAVMCDCGTSGPRRRQKAKPSQLTTNNPPRIFLNVQFSLSTLLLVVILFFTGVNSQERVHPALQKAARKELVFDRSPAPDSPHRRALIGRAAASSTAVASISATVTLFQTTSSETASGTAAVSSAVASASSAAARATEIATAPGSGKSGLPQPFDTSLGANFTSTACPAYFTKFLADPTFQTCYPFSLLIQTSHAFFEAEKSYVRTTIALDASCNANFVRCNTLMQNIAYKIKQPEVCGMDFNAQNPLVLQAYEGLLAYSTMYQAGCLKDPAGSYCFADAITGTNSSLADVYPYWLPLGTDMPSGVRATCTTCMKNTMGIFRASAANSSLPISKTYVAAAQLFNIGCGPDYVSDTIDFRTASSAAVYGISITPLITLLFMFAAFFA